MTTPREGCGDGLPGQSDPSLAQILAGRTPQMPLAVPEVPQEAPGQVPWALS
jgi:hypothetical protein